MRLDIRAHSLGLIPFLREHVKRQIAFAFSRYGSQIVSISVELDGADCQSGDESYRCRTRVNLGGENRFDVEVDDPDLEVAIRRSVERAARRVRMAIERVETPSPPAQDGPKDSYYNFLDHKVLK